MLFTSSISVINFANGTPTNSIYIQPNIDELIFKKIQDIDAQVTMLKNGEIDIVPYVQSLESYNAIKNDPSIEIYQSLNGSTSMACLFFNCRVAPLNDKDFRKALSSLIDRQFIAEELLNGLATPSYTYIPPSLNVWVNDDARSPDFNPLKSIDTLYNDGYTWDIQTKLSKDGEPLRELTLLTPLYEEAQGLWVAGNYTAWVMSKYGVPVKHVAIDELTLIQRLVETRDFDLCIYDFDYTLTPLRLYGLLHSQFDTPLTLAYCGIHDQSLDAALEDLWQSIDKTDSINYAHDTQQILLELSPYVPIYSMSKLSVVGSNWVGTINIEGVGVLNRYTYTEIHTFEKPHSGKLTQPIDSDMHSLNPLTYDSIQTSSNEILNLIYLPLIETDTNSSEDKPILAENWNTETWNSEITENGMKITFNLKEDIKWQDGEPFTSKDVKFCIEYIKSKSIPQYGTIWKNLVKVETPDEKTVEIYLNDTGLRYLYAYSAMTFLPEHIWKDVEDYQSFKPWQESNPITGGLTKLVGQGPFTYIDGDLTNYVRLVWNPLFYNQNPDKTSLVETSSSPNSANLGDVVDLSYIVRNQVGTPLNSTGSFKLYIKSGDGTVVHEQVAQYEDNAYHVFLNTVEVGQGSYICTFIAYPYGSTSTELIINAQEPQPSQGIPGFPISSILLAFMLVYILRIYKTRKLNIK